MMETDTARQAMTITPHAEHEAARCKSGGVRVLAEGARRDGGEKPRARRARAIRRVGGKGERAVEERRTSQEWSMCRRLWRE
ncbi:hypothetical protein PUN28_007841 [Cardiocondyla obscurior]|uniref:Uncharacterized protein n=1 Tax=Cardiocondyla obscurior TaxID=286306 RepID=A0AAW2FX51_9HYME